MQKTEKIIKKKYFFRTLKVYGLASTQSLKDGLRFSSEMGFTPVKLDTGHKFVTRLVFNYFNTDVVLALYPYIYSPLKVNPIRTLESSLITKFVRTKFFILYVVDLPIHQNIALGNYEVIDEKAYRLEKKIFESADIICVFNELMKKTIQEYTSIPDEKFVEFEILDYGVKVPQPIRIMPETHVKMVYAGNLERKIMGSSISMLSQMSGINYEFFGQNGDWINTIERQDMKYCGVLQPEELLKYISSNAHFGLLFRDLNNTHLTNYHNLGATSKFSAYTAAGLPILAPSRYSYISYLIKKYKIGYSFDSLQEIASLAMKVINSDEYNKTKENCLELGKKIRDGYFFKRTVNSALKSAHT